MLDSTAWQEQEEEQETPSVGRKMCVAHASAREKEEADEKKYYPLFMGQ